MAHAGFPLGLSLSIEQITKQINKNNRHQQLFIIEYNKIAIGEMNYHIDEVMACEIGIKICDASMHNKGYGKRALQLLINYLFKELPIAKIILDTNFLNKRARHVYESLGFSLVRMNANAWIDQVGVWQTSLDYELTKTTYFKIQENWFNR
jgi:RimJ/RimL family protein N-acetyltransferase